MIGTILAFIGAATEPQPSRRCPRARTWLALAVLIAHAPALAQTCPDHARALTQAAGGGDLARVAQAWRAAKAPAAGCGEQTLFCLGRRAALAHVEAAYAQADKGAGAAELEAMLDEPRRLEYGEPWPLLVLRGDVRLARAKAERSAALHAEAARDFQAALNEIAEPALCGEMGETRPETAEIARIHGKAAEAQLLAARFVATPTRSGACGGVMLPSVRGFTPKARPLPITFGYNQAELDAPGAEAAMRLAECLKAERVGPGRDQPVRRVVLSGHTDAVGSDGFNLELSARRLKTVEAFLKRNGLDARIELLPKGKAEPFPLDDPGGRDPKEIDQLNRRVEVRETGP